MKTITSLINANKKVYVRMSSDEICKAFFAQAENEGFLFGGMKPTAKHPSDLIAVLSDKTLCYVGTIGRMAAGSGAETRRKYCFKARLAESITQRGFLRPVSPCVALCAICCRKSGKYPIKPFAPCRAFVAALWSRVRICAA